MESNFLGGDRLPSGKYPSNYIGFKVAFALEISLTGLRGMLPASERNRDAVQAGLTNAGRTFDCTSGSPRQRTRYLGT